MPHPKDTSHGSGTPSVASPNTHEGRIANLREILYMYAQEHPQMGYRQGMHEIASYLLYVLELEEPQYADHPLFTPPLPICFVLLEHTLDQLQLAYDASVDKTLQQMSLSILGKLYQNDKPLYNHLTTCPNIPPPPIYCTRWVRLMFSREVVGYENVFDLWDVFFEYYPTVMRSLEVTCASRILLMRDALLNPEQNPLDLLMNIPPLRDIAPLTTTLRRLMAQTDSDQPIEIPASQLLLPTSPDRPPLTASSATTTPHQLTPLHNPMLQQQQQQQQGPYSLGTPSSEVRTHAALFPASHGNNATTTSSTTFSFSKMRQSLNQKSESIRKKLLNTTSEWKQQTTQQQQQQQQQNDPLTGTNGSIRNRASSTGEMDHYHRQRQSHQKQQQQQPPPSQQQSVFTGTTTQFVPAVAHSGIMTAASQAIRHWQDELTRPPTEEEVLFADPLLHVTTPTRVVHYSGSGQMPANSSNRSLHPNQSHGWASQMQQQIWNVQQFLMALEQQNNRVPRDVWESLAELDRIQREIHAHSMDSPFSP